MNLRLSTHQIQKQTFAPVMRQSVEILMLSAWELSDVINEEIQENPLLEIDEKLKSADDAQLNSIIDFKIHSSPSSQDENNFNQNDDENDPPFSQSSNPAISLEEHLLKQLRLEISDPLQQKIGETIIHHLNHEGYLTLSFDELSQLTNCDDHDLIKDVLETIQSFDPVGIACRNLRECLIVQAQNRYNGTGTLMVEIIANHFEDLGRKKYDMIGRRMKLSRDEVSELARKIASLEPHPAQKYRPDEINIYIKPEITIFEDPNGEFRILINKDDVPPLRISQTYKKLLNRKNLSPDEETFIREKIRAALFFIKSIEQRHETVRKITEFIVNYQEGFLRNGHLELKPLTLKDVAEKIGRNESTVCRAVQNKFIDTPQGVFPLKYFFSHGLTDGSDKAISNQSVKEEILNIIEEENKEHPLSDQEILKELEKRRLNVARRTISKYRQALKIPPSNFRRRDPGHSNVTGSSTS